MGDEAFLEFIRKKLHSLNDAIAEEQARLAQSKSAMSDQPWYERRAGATKHYYNLLEERQVILLKSVFPELTFYAQAEYAGFLLPNGQRVPIENVRIPDIVQVFGDEVQPYDLKTPNAILTSVKGGLKKSKQLEGDFRESSYLQQQLAKEKAIIEQAVKFKAKILISCREPLNDVSSVLLKVDPANLRLSAVLPYGKVPDKLLGGRTIVPPGFKVTAGTIAADGSIIVADRPGTSQLPNLQSEPIPQARATAGALPTAKQRGTAFTGAVEEKYSGAGIPMSRDVAGSTPATPKTTLPSVRDQAIKYNEAIRELQRSTAYRVMSPATKVIGGGGNLFLGGVQVINFVNQWNDGVVRGRMEIDIPGEDPSKYEVGKEWTIEGVDESTGKVINYVIKIRVEKSAWGRKHFYVVEAYTLA
jgi:hypothetical protein